MKVYAALNLPTIKRIGLLPYVKEISKFGSFCFNLVLPSRFFKTRINCESSRVAEPEPEPLRNCVAKKPEPEPEPEP